MEYRPFRIALKTAFRGTTERSGVLVRDVGADAHAPWGEYSPFADYSPERAHRWWLGAIEAARGEWPAPVRDSVAVNSIVPTVDVAAVGGYATANGCRTAKVKVGGA